MSLTRFTAAALGRKIKAGEVSVREAVTDALCAIREKEPLIRGFVTVEEARAFARAEEVQKAIADGSLQGPLAGVPVAVKDNLCTKGIRTT